MTKNADIPVKYSFDNKKRDIIPVLGQGAIKIDARAQALQEEYSRDVREFIGKTKGKKASLDAAIPISDIAEFLKTSFSSKDVSGISAGDGPEKEESEEETEQEKERRLLLEKAEKQKLEHEIKSAEEKISSTLKKKYANDIPEFSQDGEIAEKQSLILCDMMDKIAASGASDGLMEITNIAFALYMDTESGQKGQASPEQIDSAIAEAKSFMSKGELSPALSKLALGKQSYDEYQGLLVKKTQFDYTKSCEKQLNKTAPKNLSDEELLLKYREAGSGLKYIFRTLTSEEDKQIIAEYNKRLEEQGNQDDLDFVKMVGSSNPIAQLLDKLLDTNKFDNMLEQDLIGQRLALLNKLGKLENTGNKVKTNVTEGKISDKPSVLKLEDSTKKPVKDSNSIAPNFEVQKVHIDQNTGLVKNVEIPAYKELKIYENHSIGIGRDKNTIKGPNPNAKETHIVAKIDRDGQIQNYVVYKPNPKNPTGFAEYKRVDLSGDPHYN